MSSAMASGQAAARPAGEAARARLQPTAGRTPQVQIGSRASRALNGVLPVEEQLGCRHLKIAAGLGTQGQAVAGSSPIALPQHAPHRHGSGHGRQPGAAGARRPVVVWFRNDLRLHDNEALVAANTDGSSILPVYCFDPRDYGKSPSGFNKTGPYRAKFTLESVHSLRNQLQDAGSDLVVRMGSPEEVIPELVRRVGAGAVYCHQEVTKEDIQVRDAVDAPATLKGLPLGQSVEAGEIPSLQQLGMSSDTVMRAARDRCAVGASLRGGEGEALEVLQRFVRESRLRSSSPGVKKASENGATTSLRSQGSLPCQLSPWLAAGCLSPRLVHRELVKLGGVLKNTVTKGSGTKGRPQTEPTCMMLELLWRDFFRFAAKKSATCGMRLAHEAAVA
eukprot:evm.model.scf_2139.2 EVM.evm.TU.scf_2139.2   scf_2139:6122-14578(+)